MDDLDNLKKQRNNARCLNVILIIIIILLLLFWYIVGYRMGKIGFGHQETIAPPTDEITQGDKDKDNADQKEYNIPEILVTQGDIKITKDTHLNIFNNEKFNGEKIIAPGSDGVYQFCVRNKSNYDITYDLNFTDEMQYSVNMKYKLKIDNVYIKGNKDEYKNLEDIQVKEIIVPKESANIYTLEWYWVDDNKNDTIVGSQENNQYYKLNLEINAKEYIK